MHHAARWSAVLALGTLLPPARAADVLWTFQGTEADAAAGTAAALIGDVNGDGRAEIAVGEPGYGNAPAIPNRGRLRVFDGATGLLLWSRTGSDPVERFGAPIAAGADVTGDGIPDLIAGRPGKVTVAGPFAQTFHGAIAVLDGATGASVKEIISSQAQDGFGEVLAFAPDLDGDGFPEVAAGKPRATVMQGSTALAEAGQVLVVYSLNNLPVPLFGTAANSHFGSAVAAIPDQDGDGIGELAVGVPDVGATLPVPPWTVEAVGRIALFHVVANPFGGGSAYASISGTFFSEGLRLGAVLAPGGDVDGDGIGDLLAGCPDLGAGQVRVYHGAHNGLLQTWHGTSNGDRFGASVASAGDVNGDGRADVAIGAPDGGDVAQVLSFNRGVVEVRSGLDGAAMMTVKGSTSQDHLGAAVGGGFDVDGDGRPDVVAGEPDDDAVASGAGLVRVYGVLDHPATATLLGAGVAGTLGVPAIGLALPPETCHSTSLVLGNSAPGAAPTTVFLSATFQPVPTGFGGTLYASPALLAAPLLLPAGGLAIPFTVPCDPALWGAALYLQQLVADAGAPKGVAFSQALEVVIGGF